MKCIGNLKLEIRNSCRGFTVVELILYMGILTILLTVLTEVFGSILDTQLESQAVSSVEQDARFILSRLTYDIMNAQSITTPINLGDQTQTLQLTKSGIDYTYSVAGGNFSLTDNFGTDQLNSFDSTISNLSFTRLGASSGKPTITIEFTLTSLTRQAKGPETKSFQTTVGLR